MTIVMRKLALAALVAVPPAAVLVLAPAIAAAAPGRVSQEQSAQAKGTVQINNVSGSVDVSGWNHNKVKVTGTLGEGVRELKMRTTGGRTQIKVIGPERGGRMQASHLQINVPRGSTLDIVTVSATVSISDVDGDYRVKTVSGNVKSRGKPAEAEYVTVSGDMEVTAGSRQTRATSVSGKVDVKGKSKTLVMKTVSGEISTESPMFQRCEIGSVSGSIAVRGKLGSTGPVNLKSHSGNVTIDLAGAVNAAFDLTSFSGAIRSSLGGEPQSGRGPGKSLKFEHGSGGPDVVVRTFSGDIRLTAK